MADETQSGTSPDAQAPVPSAPPEPTMPEPSVRPEPTAPTRQRPMVLVALLALGALAMVAFAVLGYQTFSQRLEAARQLDTAKALVEDADEILVAVDSVVRAKVEPSLAPRAQEALADAGKAEGLLKEAIALLDLAGDELTDDELEQAELLRTSATTRQEMLRFAPLILKANSEAASALTPSEEGWDALLEADKLSDRAVASYNKLTKTGVRQSQKLNLQAAEKLGESNKRFQAAEEAFSAASFEDYLEYVGTRIKLNKLSQQSDKAWLADEIAKANRIISDYNKLDAKAVKQAAKLPADTQTAVATAYAQVAEELTDKYYDAREKALEADKALRAY